MNMTRIYIETYGCALNQADSETMAGLLEAAGYLIVKRAEEADLIIINTCTVKERTQWNFLKRLGELRRDGRCYVIAGCIPSAMPDADFLKGESVIGVEAICSIADAVRSRIANGQVKISDKSLSGAKSQVELPYKSVHNVIAIVPIAQGCLGHCSYCQTRLARGALRSFPVDSITRRVEQELSDTIVREIWLTAQDTGAFGKDSGSSLTKLISALLALQGRFRIRLGMANPEHVLPILDPLLDLFSDERLFKFLHLPLQSGSDSVLKAMGRQYSTREFMTIVDRIRNTFQEFSIATDVIAGFPTETEDDFTLTLSLLDKIRPAVVNRSKYSSRPLTPAARLPLLSSSIVQERSRRLTERVEAISAMENHCWIGWKGLALVDLQKREDSLICRNFAYKPIILPLNAVSVSPALGSMVDVSVIEAATFHLIGSITDTEKTP